MGHRRLVWRRLQPTLVQKRRTTGHGLQSGLRRGLSAAVWAVHQKILRFSNRPTRRDSNVPWKQCHTWAWRDRNRGPCPYNYEFEAALFIDQNGAVSGRLSLTKDLLLTQRLILQARFETNAAVQRVEEFTTGSGLNNLEFGVRLRYEIRREFAPYVGFSLDGVLARPPRSCAKRAATRVRFDSPWACGRGFGSERSVCCVLRVRTGKTGTSTNQDLIAE